MRCPACQARVIDFGAWGQGLNAFRKVDCPNCSVPLRASQRTFVVFTALLALLVPFVVILALALGALGVPEATGRVIFGCLMIPFVVVVAYWEWNTGFYVLRKDGEGRAEPGAAADRPRDRR